MKFSQIILLIMVIGGGIGILKFSKQRVITTTEPVESLQPVAQPTSMPSAKATIAHSLTPKLMDEAPRLDTLRHEVGKNPHRTPPSLLRFADAIAQKMETLNGNQTKAKDLFDELEKCVFDQDSPESVKSMCLINSSRLAKKFPVLEDSYNRLKDTAPGASVRALEAFSK